MAPETLLFPIGPVQFDGTDLFGLMICTPEVEIQTVWAEDWQAAFASALNVIPDGSWTTVHRMADQVPIAKGKGRNLLVDQVIRLARPVGDLYDHSGFAYLTSDMKAYELMKAMADYLPTAIHMADGRSQPVVIDIKDATDHSVFFGGIGRDGDAGYIYVTQTSEMLVKLIETSYGMDLPDWVGFVMARVEPGQGWIGQATHDLFGVSFQPMVRSRSTSGETRPISDQSVKFLNAALSRAGDIARGANSATGKVVLYDWIPEVEMWRFAP